MGKPMRAVPGLFVMTIAMIGLSACGTSGVSSSDEQRKSAVMELEKRGFEDPTFVTDQYGRTDEMRFTAKVGECRVSISRTGGGVYSYMDTNWTDEQRKAVDEIAGGSVADDVNASFIRTYGDRLGWAHCLAVAPTK